jgi:hypothetical protein
LIALRTARELRSAGISTQALRRVIRFLRKGGARKPLSELRLVIRGQDVLAATSNEELLSTLESPGQYAFFFLLDIGHVVREVEEAMVSMQAA